MHTYQQAVKKQRTHIKQSCLGSRRFTGFESYLIVLHMRVDSIQFNVDYLSWLFRQFALIFSTYEGGAVVFLIHGSSSPTYRFLKRQITRIPCARGSISYVSTLMNLFWSSRRFAMDFLSTKTWDYLYDFYVIVAGEWVLKLNVWNTNSCFWIKNHTSNATVYNFINNWFSR